MAHEQIVVGQAVGDAVAMTAERVVAVLGGNGRSRSVALAGGSTPKALYRLLASPAYRDRVDWKRVHWFWGDERCVPPDHADSNYRMAMAAMLEPLGIGSEMIHRMPADADDLESAAETHAETIREHVAADSSGVPVFDVVLLGMGPDGHTASLFPGSAGLEETEKLVVAHHVPSQDTNRMTMTYPLIRNARDIVFLVTGANKAVTLAEIFSPENKSTLPSAALRPSREHAAKHRLTWVLDSDAAALLQKS